MVALVALVEMHKVEVQHHKVVMEELVFPFHSLYHQVMEHQDLHLVDGLLVVALVEIIMVNTVLWKGGGPGGPYAGGGYTNLAASTAAIGGTANTGGGGGNVLYMELQVDLVVAVLLLLGIRELSKELSNVVAPTSN